MKHNFTWGVSAHTINIVFSRPLRLIAPFSDHCKALQICYLSSRMAQAGKKAALIGSGNWGSAIARIVGATTRDLPDFQSEVKMWVFPEKVNGRDLGDIINTEHENVKYLPGFKIPENVVACPDVIETIKDADILIFVVPHQFIARICEQIKDHIKPGVFGISLIKGMDVKDGNIRLISEVINNALSIDMSVLMGANVAKDVAQEDFCESTIGCRSTEQGDLLKKLFHSPTFQIRIIPDLVTVELCGALKNIVAVAAGFCDGLQYGTSTKAAVLRIGLGEMWQFIKIFGGQDSISLLESCGVADLIATCFGGRNRRVSEAFVTSGKSFEVLEAEMLDGQKLQGPLTAKEVHEYLTKEGKTDQFPLFNVVHSICYEGLPPSDLLKSIAKL